MNPLRNLTSGTLLAKNTIWSLAGNVASILIALFSVPILLRYLGTDRLGVITLVWVVEGQFGIFDLGLSFALTKLVSEKLGASKEEDTPAIFWMSLAIMAALGLVGSVILWTASPWLVHHALKVPLAIQSETVTSFHLVAFSLPVVISSAALRGLLSAHQKFALLNISRVPISLFSYLVPLLVLPFSKTLGMFVFVLVMARFLTWITYLVLCFHVSPILRAKITLKGAPVRHMFRFGGWMTLTNLVGPIMVNMDRILIGSLISMAAVAYYATPYEAATKLWIISSSITGVLFPALAATLVRDRMRAALLVQKAVKYIFLSLFPITLGVISFGHWGLQIWLGTTFAHNSNVVLKLLTIGVFANSLAQVPFWQIQAAGRPDLAAKTHLLELPCYLFVFWRLTTTYGIIGAGIAWILRTSIDAVIMFWLAQRLLPETKPACRHLVWTCLLILPLLIISANIDNFATAAVFVSICYGTYAIITWNFLLDIQEKLLVFTFFRLFRFRFSESQPAREEA